MLFLNRTDVGRLLSMRETIGLMREVFPEITRGTVTMPERVVIEPGKAGNAVLFMPGYVPQCHGVAIKIVSVFPGNVARGLSTISALIVLNDDETGETVAVMDGGYITAMRTGATSGLATDLLARADVQSLGVFGSGVQARTQIAAILEVRPINRVLVYDPVVDRSQALIGTMTQTYGDQVTFTIAASPDALVKEADVIVTATTATTPVFDGTLLRKGTHVNSIGSFKPNVREVDDSTVRRARIVVDGYDACLAEAGDLLIPMNNGTIARSDIRAELGELVLKTKKGRESDEDITYFKSVGMSVQDVIVAKWVYDRAIAQKLGRDLPMEEEHEDSKNRRLPGSL